MLPEYMSRCRMESAKPTSPSVRSAVTVARTLTLNFVKGLGSLVLEGDLGAREESEILPALVGEDGTIPASTHRLLLEARDGGVDRDQKGLLEVEIEGYDPGPLREEDFEPPQQIAGDPRDDKGGVVRERP